MAHITHVTEHRCPKCRRIARWEVFNHYNASCGRFCKRHADEALASIMKTPATERPWRE